MRKMSSVVASVVSAISCIVVVPPLAKAEKRGGTPPGSVSVTLTFGAGELFGECAFPMQLDINGKVSTITLPGGRFILTAPKLSATLTNLSDPTKSVTLNVTGTTHQSTDQNGDVVSVINGRNLAGDPDAGLVLAIGSFSFKFDANGTLVQPLAGTGQLIKVCPMIS